MVGNLTSSRTGRQRGDVFRRLLGRVHIGLSRIARRRGRRILHAIIVFLMCLSLGAQQTHADMAFWEWMHDTRVSYSMTWLTRMGMWARLLLAEALLRQVPPTQPTVPFPAPGAPYPWQSSEAVAPYSVVNLTNGNLFTAVPLFELPGAGEALSFAVFHNSQPTWLNDDFNLLPPGWSHSYTRRLYFHGYAEQSSGDGAIQAGDLVVADAAPSEDAFLIIDEDPQQSGPPGPEQFIELLPAAISLVTDDGRVIVFENVNNQLVPPPGTHLTVEWTGEGSTREWIIRDQARNRDVFDPSGRLIRRHDAAGNTITFEYEFFPTVGQSVLTKVLGVNGRVTNQPPIQPLEDAIVLEYDAISGQLSRVLAPKDGSAARSWDIRIDDMLWVLTGISSGRRAANGVDPAHWLTFEYDSNQQLGRIIDWDGHAWDLELTEIFSSWVLTRVLAPPVVDYKLEPPGAARSERTYAYLDRVQRVAPGGFIDCASFLQTLVTDERGGIWRYAFDDGARVTATHNPLWEPTLSVIYDTRNNVRSQTGWLAGSTTLMEYDAADNLTRITDPLGAVTTLEYDAEDRLVRHAPPVTGGVDAGVHYEYADVSQPRGPSLIDGPGAADVRLTYGEDPGVDLGRTIRILNPNGIIQRTSYHANPDIPNPPANRPAKGSLHRTTFGRATNENFPDRDVAIMFNNCVERCAEARCSVSERHCLDGEMPCYLGPPEHVCGRHCENFCDDDGNPLSTCEPSHDGSEEGCPPQQGVFYDGNGRPTEIRSFFPEGRENVPGQQESQFLKTAIEYDALGRTTWEDTIAISSSGAPQSSIFHFAKGWYGSPLRRNISAWYRPSYTLFREFSASTGSQRTHYHRYPEPGAPESDLQIVTELETNPAGRLTRVRQEIHGQHVVEATYAYDRAARTITETRGALATEYQLDAAGRTIAVVHRWAGAEKLAILYERDARGRITEMREVVNGQAPGVITRYTYGDGAIPQSELDPPGQVDPARLYWHWISAFALQASDPNRLVCEEEVGQWKKEYFYDPGGNRLARRQSSWNGTAWAVDEITRYNYSKQLAVELPNSYTNPAVDSPELLRFGWDIAHELDGEPSSADSPIGNNYDVNPNLGAIGRDRLISYKTYYPSRPDDFEFTVYRYESNYGKKTPTVRITQSRTFVGPGEFETRRRTWKYDAGFRDHIDVVQHGDWRRPSFDESGDYGVRLAQLAECYGWDSHGRRVVTSHADVLPPSGVGNHTNNWTAYDHDGGQVLVERREGRHKAAYAHGAFGPLARTQLDTPDGVPCVNWLLSDGRGNTIGVADNQGNIQQQRFDAFGNSLGRRVISTCPKTSAGPCDPPPSEPAAPGCAARLATGELGYHGQEGYRTRHYDAHRQVPLPTHERPNGSIFDGEQQHPDYDPAYPAGYETASTGFIMVGAREYDPEIGRFLQPDPQPTGPELQWGQLNRWAYCANDPVNFSDPTGQYLMWLFGLGMAVGAGVGGVIGFSLSSRTPITRLRILIAALFSVLMKLAQDSVNYGLCSGQHAWQKAFSELLVAMGLGAAYGKSLIGSAMALGTAGAVMLGGFIIGMALGMAIGSVAGAAYGALAFISVPENGRSDCHENDLLLRLARANDAIASHRAQQPSLAIDPVARAYAEGGSCI